MNDGEVVGPSAAHVENVSVLYAGSSVDESYRDGARRAADFQLSRVELEDPECDLPAVDGLVLAEDVRPREAHAGLRVRLVRRDVEHFADGIAAVVEKVAGVRGVAFVRVVLDAGPGASLRHPSDAIHRVDVH